MGMPPNTFTPTVIDRLKDWLLRALRGELHYPPWWLRDVGGTHFRRTGKEFLQIFSELGHLSRQARVLEIGCGSGRMALPLTGYLDTKGTYVGVDITLPSILWCQRHITSRHPNFTFIHTDLYNQRYNPDGRQLARDYVFPFPDGAFDFIFLTSVFTHLLPEDATHYLGEVARLLAAEGQALFTFFLLNAQQETLAKAGRNDIQFHYGEGPVRIRDQQIPESAVAYDESYVLMQLSCSGLTLNGPIHYGTWSGRADGLSYQDILLVHRI